MKRRKSREVRIGDVTIGGDHPVAVQSMTTTDTRDVKSTVNQIQELADAGCEIVRVAVPDMEAAQNLAEIKRQISVPLVADIHFHYQLALEAISQGVDKLRLNPGNIGSLDRVRKVVKAAKERQIPIRVGVNGGSLKDKFMVQYGRTPKAMVESALEHVRLLEDLDFDDIVISLKASEIHLMVESYEMMAPLVDYPLHLGVTEAGTPFAGTIKSSIGIGHLLYQGIGDTIRISLTADPVEEVKVAYQILKSLGLRRQGLDIISCPTCGRCEIDLIGVAEKVTERLQDVKEPLSVAVMGCVVNGIGEGKHADIGLAGGNGQGVIFRDGEIIRRVKEEEMVDALEQEVRALAAERENRGAPA